MNITIRDTTYNIMPDDDYLKPDSVFEPETTDLMSKLVKPSDVILDIGANIGCTSILFSTLGNSVYAFEPSPTTYSFLKQNIKNNNIDNIQISNIGLGSASQTTTLTHALGNRSGAFVSDQFSDDIQHIVESIQIETLDSIFIPNKTLSIDFIKIDTEGYELNVLEGASELLTRDHPIVYLEMNHWCLNVFQRICLPDFLDKLTTTFESVYAIDDSGLLDLNIPTNRYKVMYNHILRWKYNNLICGNRDDINDRFNSN